VVCAKRFWSATGIAVESVTPRPRQTIHHRAPGKSVMNLMLSLCPGCHAKVHRTKAALSAMPPLLLALWGKANNAVTRGNLRMLFSPSGEH